MKIIDFNSQEKINVGYVKSCEDLLDVLQRLVHNGHYEQVVIVSDVYYEDICLF